MHTLEIPVKYQMGDNLYTTKQVKVEHTCSICKGEKKINYQGKDIKCPECMGVGKFTSTKQKWVVIEEPYIITDIKIIVKSNSGTSVKYKGKCGTTILNRVESNLFLTKEKAQEWCDKCNIERVYIKLDDIVIPNEFKASKPSITKVQAKINYCKENGKFDKDIIIDTNNILQDGYITYLLSKMLGFDAIKAVVMSKENFK